MKHRTKIAIAFLLILGATLPSVADDKRIELTPFYGYRFNGSFDDFYDPNGLVRSLDLQDGGVYGLIMDVNMGENAQIELSWSRQETTLRGSLFGGGRVDVTDLDVDYYQVGGNYVFGDDFDDTRGFVGASFGLSYFGPDSRFSSESKFAFAFQGGVKHFFGEGIGIRAQGRLVSTYVNSSPGYWCYVYCYYSSVSNYQVTGEVDLGIVFKF